MSKIETRLKRLERIVARRRTPDACPRKLTYETEEDWLARFEELGRQGFFADEPDFTTALAFYRDAIHEARASGCPPAAWLEKEWVRMDGTGKVIPHGEDVNRGVPCCLYRFPKVREGWQWLSGMMLRDKSAIPPVTQAEFKELVDWLGTNVKRLNESAGLLRVAGPYDTSYLTSASELNRTMAENGPRSTEAPQLAHAVRQLRAGCGAT